MQLDKNQFNENFALILKNSEKKVFDSNELIYELGIVNKNFVDLNNNQKGAYNYLEFLSKHQDISERSILSFIKIVNDVITRPLLNIFLSQCESYGITVNNGYRLVYIRNDSYKDVFEGDKEYSLIKLIMDAICHRYHVKSMKSVKYDLDIWNTTAFYGDIQLNIRKQTGCSYYKTNYKFDTNDSYHNLLSVNQSKQDINKNIYEVISSINMSGRVKKDKINTLMNCLININTNYDLSQLYTEGIK